MGKLLQSHLDIAQTVDQTKMLTSSNQYIRPDYLAPMPNAVSVFPFLNYTILLHILMTVLISMSYSFNHLISCQFLATVCNQKKLYDQTI